MPAHAGGEIVPSMVELDGVSEGVLDFATTCTMYWMDRFGPACNLFTYQIAGLTPTEQFFWMQEEGLDLLEEMTADYNVVWGPGFQTVPEAFIGSKEAITGPADFKGLKIRTAGDDGKIFTDMGAIAMYEVVDHLYVGSSRQPQEWQPQMWNRDTWNEFPDDLKKICYEMGAAAGINYYRFMVMTDLASVPLWESQGVPLEFIPQSVSDEVVRRADILYSERAAADPFFDKTYKSIQNFKKVVRGTWERM